MTLEDETGTSRIVIMPDFYEKNRMVILKERFVKVPGEVEKHDGVVHLRARNIATLAVSAAAIVSHDFH
jgi:error-prone DNA polymerase